MNKRLLLPGWTVLALCLAIACKPSEVPDPDPDPDPNPDTSLSQAEADALLRALRFYGDTTAAGKLPDAPALDLLQMNWQDTMFALPGAYLPIRFKHPENQPIAGFWAGIANGSFYRDVPVTEVYDGDTVSVILIEAVEALIPENNGEPHYIPVKIIAYDGQKQPVDAVERIVTISRRSSAGCDIAIPPTTDSAWLYTWYSTVIFRNGSPDVFSNTPGKPHATRTDIEGCCNPAEPDGRCNPLSTTLNASVSFESLYVINSEDLTFYTDGSYVRKTEEVKRNFDPTFTNWCAGIAGYTTLRERVDYTGTHNATGPGATELVLGAGTSSCDICGYGFTGGKLECPFGAGLMLITRDRRNLDGTLEYRVYYRNDVVAYEWAWSWYY